MVELPTQSCSPDRYLHATCGWSNNDKVLYGWMQAESRSFDGSFVFVTGIAFKNTIDVGSSLGVESS